MKMHLAAVVPNEGARRLAWAIAQQHDADIVAFAAAAQVSCSVVDRLIAGEIVPGTDLALPVGFASDGFVSRMDWQREPAGWWFDRPSARPSLRRMAGVA
ncbi:hypothetical protein U1769_24295 [Sphingomonas sp. ZT3P38]|uniref:hypothetical protein n=1 Tax=Parasphingomonas zepuensis TaxID=3096161 RepID=UPI002FC63A09